MSNSLESYFWEDLNCCSNKDGGMSVIEPRVEMGLGGFRLNDTYKCPSFRRKKEDETGFSRKREGRGCQAPSGFWVPSPWRIPARFLFVCFKYLIFREALGSGLPGGAGSQGRRCQRGRLDPGLGRSLEVGAWQPVPVYLPWESRGTQEPGGLWSESRLKGRCRGLPYTLQSAFTG